MAVSSNTPPEVLTVKADDDWSPFVSRAGFELAEFMFTDAELSQRKINKLLELWAATLIPHNDSPPITNHRNLHQQVDAIKLGNVQWENTRLKYDGPLPNTIRHPEWKTTEYDVWYRDPRQVIKNLLASPELEGHIDYAAYQEFNGERRQYGNVMSGNWAWQQSVRFTGPIFLPTYLRSPNRTPLLRTYQPMDLCLFQLSWGLIKRQYLSPPVKMTSTRYISRSEMFKTTFDVRTRTRWC